VYELFNTHNNLNQYFTTKTGLSTGNNSLFLRYWSEVAFSKIKFDATSMSSFNKSGYKWCPLDKGGAYRKWYGNYDYIVNWENNGYEIRHYADYRGKIRSRPQNRQFYFLEALTWSDVTSGDFAMRLRKPGSIYTTVGLSAFPKHEEIPIQYFLGALNSTVANYLFKILNPTIHLNISDVGNFPIVTDMSNYRQISIVVSECLRISQKDWDSFELSWDFSKQPLMGTIAEHTVLVICHIHRRISKIRVTAKHPFKKLATWWHKIQNVPKKCQTFGLGGH
jgi:hypothetical protein